MLELLITIKLWQLLLPVTLALSVIYLLWRNQRKIQQLEQQSQVADLQAQLSQLQIQLDSANLAAAEKLQQTESLLAQQKLQFENLANRIFESRQNQFQQQSKQTLDASIQPLKEQLEQFRRRVDQVHNEDVTDRNQLKSYIENLQQKTEKIGNDAVNLSKALKGNNKFQGNWGEMVLERLLEESGLVKNQEYKIQASFSSDNNRRLQPDVVIYLPEGKSLIVDSKLSLLHYESYVNSDDDAERSKLLQLHVQSLRQHFKDLSSKDYQQIEDLKTVDFVFMFIPVEPAYLLALQHYPELFNEAFSRNVTMVSHTTLMPLLRTVDMLWRTDKQNRNAMEIANQAGRLYDKFVGVLESVDDIGKHLQRTESAYLETRKRLSEGQGNLVGRIDNLKRLGAKTKHQIPDSFQMGQDEQL